MNNLIGFIDKNWILRLEVALRFIEAQNQPIRVIPKWMNILMVEQGCNSWEEIK